MSRIWNRIAVAVLAMLGVAVIGVATSDGSVEMPRGSVAAAAIPSSDIGTLLFTRTRTDGKPALFTIAPDGSHLRLFAVRASSAAVSQDGRQILFVRGGAIWVMRRDGSGQRQVTRPPRNNADGDPAWSPDGQTNYFSRELGQGSWALFSVRVDGTALRRLTRGCDGRCTGGEDEPAPSPDGRVVAYTSWYHEGGEDDSYISAMTPTGRRANLGFPTSSASHEWSPAWAPDGEKLAFAALDAGALQAGDSVGGVDRVGSSGLYVSTRSGAARRIFTPDRPSRQVSQPAWSTDGRWIVFTYDRTESDRDIWIVPAAGGPAGRVTSGRTEDWGPTWLPPASG